MKDQTSSSYLSVQLQRAAGKVHQPSDLARGTNRATGRFRWQSAVHRFKAVAETTISQPLTSVPSLLRAFSTPRDAASLHPLAKR